MSFSSKKENSKNQIEKESLQSAGDTFFDSLHNSKISEYTKNRFITIKKENNFYLALKCMHVPNSDTILLGTSEYSETNPNQTKDYNISRYLHHPITKEINKEGNNLIRIKPKQNYNSLVNYPYISKYNNMKNIIKNILISVKDVQENEKLDKKNIKYFSNNININEDKMVHKKSNSSFSNKLYNNSNKNIKGKKNSNNNKIKTTKNNKYNQINSTTVTKDNNENNYLDIQDIKKHIKYDDYLQDLEESKDIDIKNYIINEEDYINKNIIIRDNINCELSSYKTNKSILEKENAIDDFNNINKIKNNSISTKKDEILVIDSFNEGYPNQNLNEKNENKNSTVKKLRKKYERAEFKKYIYNTNPHVNRYIYENQEITKEIIANKRKKTEELGLRKNKKSKNKNIDNNYLIKHNINISSKNFSELEDSLSQLSKNINKNLLDNFNNCGNYKNNEFLMRNRNELNGNFNLNNQNININSIESPIDAKDQYSPPQAELIDFVSSKSNNNNNSNNNFNPDENQNEDINYNINYSNNNTFIIKNIENKLDIFSDISNNNLYYELNRSAKSEYKINHIQNNPLNQNQIPDNSTPERYKKYDDENDNNFYDFVTPDRNPEAIIRTNFSLISSYYKVKTNSDINSYKNKFNSLTIDINKTKLQKELSILSEKSLNENKVFNSVNSKSHWSKRNISYLNQNKEKIRDSISNQQPETIYDLTFYKNLIENNSKIRKINYKNILKNQKKLKWEDRAHTLVWMMQICEEFAFKRDTFHYACNYFDNFLTFGKEKIKNKKILQLIGITCISISGKIEEVQIPKLKEYANSIDDCFDIKDIIDMEQKICKSLKWKLISVNINTWLNWYTCQWDLYIDSVDDIKSQLLKYIKEEQIIYYKKSNDNSYYNYRKICQLIDIIVLDYFSYNFETRVLMSACLFIIICINYKFDYNFKKKNFRQKTAFSKYIFSVYNQFINQSFDYNFNNENIQKALNYCYQFKDFNFTFELPLLYQIHQDLLENGNYEDFISYQTTNESLEEYLKEIINKRNKKNSSEKTTNNTDTDKNKFSSSKKSFL